MKKINLVELNSACLSDVEMGQVKGGLMQKGNCTCACKYAKSGGSSTSGNGNANYKNASNLSPKKPQGESTKGYNHFMGMPSEC